jgi:hypothetical protein
MSHRIRRSLITLGLLLCALPVPAHADDEARVRSRSGIERFRRGEYAAAIADFEASYALRPLPELRFNIAQAQRSLGRCDDALAEYERYLSEAPAGRRRAQAESGAAEMRACVSAQPAAPPAPLPTTPPPEAAAPSQPPPPEVHASPLPSAAMPVMASSAHAPRERTPLYKKWWLWTALGVVVAGAVTGIAVGVHESRPREAIVPVVHLP